MKLFTLENLAGQIYRLTSKEIVDFYHEHILGKIRARFRFSDEFKIAGSVLLQLFGPSGELKDARAGANLIVTTGKNAVIDRLQAAAVAVHDFQAVGTGTTAAAAGDTALETEIGTRVQGTLSQPVATTDRLVSTFAAGNGTGALTETGRLNASSNGNLFARQVFAVVNKAAGDSLQVTHDITIS